MKKGVSIEKERLHLIARLAEMELDAALVRKLHGLLFGVPTPERVAKKSPCAISKEELVEMLRRYEANPSANISHEEFKRISAQW